MLSGEPGIGKSRLLAAFEEELRGDPHTRLRYFCSPHHQNSPLHPVIRQLEFAAGFIRDDKPADRLAKLQRLLAHSDPSTDDVALLAALLLLPADGLPKLNLSPHRRKERTFQALIHQVEYLSTERSLLMLFEDVHWADPSTREILDFLIEHLGRLRVLIVMTFRPEFLPPWIRHAGATLMTLSRLDRADATRPPQGRLEQAQTRPTVPA
jgi:predicted ATPase